MDREARRVPDLAALLDRHRDEIAMAWAQMVHRLPDSHYCEQPLEELRASAMHGLGAILEALTTGSHAALENSLFETSITRVRMGFQIAEAIEALLLCKDAALPVIWRAYPSGSAMVQESITQIDSCLRWSSGHMARLYAAEMNRQLRRQQRWMTMMLEMTQVASSSLELEQVLHRVARGIALAAGVCHCGFYLVDEERGLLIPHTGTYEHLAPSAVQAFLDRPLDLTTNAFARQVLERKEPLICCDAGTDPCMDKNLVRLLGIKSALAVPLVVRNRVLAVAVANTFDHRHIFSEEQIELVWGVANAAALAIQNARLYQQVRYLAVTEERDRLAREMHDNPAQVLSILNLKASMAEELLSGGQITQARAALLEMRQIIREAYTDIREAIFDLRATASSEMGFLGMLRQYLADYRVHYGVDTRLVVDDEFLTVFSADVELQILRIIQEALTNVRKHAGTDKAWVSFEQDGDRVRISVEDDGQGFDPALITEEDRRYFGLQIMRERAESVGGSIEFDSRFDRGTRVVIRMPLTLGE